MQSEGGVFISYASADRERVVPVVAELKDLGMRCWFDQQELRRFDAGLTERIGAGIAGTALTLAFVSTAYQESVACRWELIRTVQTSGLPGLLLVRLEDCTAEWAIVKENVFCDLSRSSPAAVGAGLKDLHPPIEERSPRGMPTQVGPEGWAGNAFEGRFDERLRLISWFTGHVGERHDQGHRSRRVQIVGLGGQGKTMLALQCATDLSNLYTGGILRLRAGGDQDSGEVANPASTLDGLLGQIHDWARDRALHLGVKVTLPERSDHNAWAQTRAVITPLVDKTLWLIDDLPAGLDGSELDRVLCPSPGDSLITTRSDAYKQYLPHTTLTLDAFSLEEAVYYLAYGSGETIDQDGAILEQIASEVGCYALALAVLRPRLESAPASEVLNNLRTAAVEELEDCAQDIGGLPAGHGASVVATLRMSVEALKRKQSVDILRLAAGHTHATQLAQARRRDRFGGRSNRTRDREPRAEGA